MVEFVTRCFCQWVLACEGRCVSGVLASGLGDEG